MATTWTRQSVNSANQVVSSSSSTTEWSRIKITANLGTNSLSLSDVDYITDSNGTGTLKNIDAIDATTEATIESAIDTLSNLTSIGTITTGVWNATAIANAYIADLPTSKVTSGTFDNARISESSVTQHQSSITALGTLSSLNVNGTANLDAVDIDGNVQLDGTLTVGVDGTSYDVKFFGDDPGNFMLWDQSEDRLEIRNDYARAGLLLSNTDAGATNSPAIDYYRNSASAAASDVLGITTYKGRNAANDADVIYARLQSSILDPTKGGEEGQFKLGVMANGSFVQDGIVLAGQSDGTVDINLGNGANSITTVNGDLTITGGNITNAITFDSGITNTGTISAGTWNGTAIADSYISSASTWNAKQNALTFGISNTNAVKIDAADVADDDYARFTANGLEGRTLAEIKSDIGTGNSGLLPSAGSDGQFLKHNGTFGNLPPNDFDVDADSGSVNIEPGETLTIAGGTGITTAISGDTLTITNDVTNTNQLTTFTLGADGGTPQTIAHGNTLTISGGTGISTSVGATDQVEVSVNGVVLTTSDQSIGGNKTFTGVTTFDDAVGFDQITVTYNSADTEVNFKSDGNKAYLVPTGNITDLNLNMPAVSGNFVLILKQDGTGSRLVTNYKVFDNSGSAASGNATVLFAGGSNPTLTTGANKTDILSFYWDADNEICYGVASLNF